MADRNYEEMDEDRLAEFLGSGGTGVVSLSRGGDEPPYSLPVSYGYDAATAHFYFRLAVDDGGKTDFLDDGHASLVVYEHTDEGWRSVVAAGDLVEVADVDVSTGVLEELRRTHIPMYDVFEDSTDETSFRFFQLDPDELTGRES